MTGGASRRCAASAGASLDVATMTKKLLQSRNLPCRAGQLQDVQAGVGAVDHVNVATVVGLHVVALDRDLALILALDLHAALVSRLGDRRNEIGGFLGPVRIADVDRAYAR